MTKTLAAAKKEPAQITDERQSQLKLLIARGKEQGFLTYVEVNDHLPSEIVDPEQIEDIVNMINDMGIPVYEKAPESETLLPTEPVVADEEAAEEAAAALATVEMSEAAAQLAAPEAVPTLIEGRAIETLVIAVVRPCERLAGVRAGEPSATS